MAYTNSANRADPDPTAHEGAIWTGSMFATPLNKELSHQDLHCLPFHYIFQATTVYLTMHTNTFFNHICFLLTCDSHVRARHTCFLIIRVVFSKSAWLTCPFIWFHTAIRTQARCCKRNNKFSCTLTLFDIISKHILDTITKTCLFKYTENFTTKKMKVFR